MKMARFFDIYIYIRSYVRSTIGYVLRIRQRRHLLRISHTSRKVFITILFRSYAEKRIYRQSVTKLSSRLKIFAESRQSERLFSLKKKKKKKHIEASKTIVHIFFFLLSLTIDLPLSGQHANIMYTLIDRTKKDAHSSLHAIKYRTHLTR